MKEVYVDSKESLIEELKTDITLTISGYDEQLEIDTNEIIDIAIEQLKSLKQESTRMTMK